jgi:hypothetical protein
MPILLCHIVWMPSYSGENEVHAAGHEYVTDEGFGHELYNFKPFGDSCYGYVQARTQTIEVKRLGASGADTFADGVTIIWTATPPDGGRVIVGWYLDARVHRDLQIGKIKGREVQSTQIGFFARARSDNCFLIHPEQRHFTVPHRGKGLPGRSMVFYPEDRGAPEMATWLKEATKYISGWTSPALTMPSGTAGSGWPSTPDASHNAAVEAAAIAFLRKQLGIEKRDRQKDNCAGIWNLRRRAALFAWR